MFYGQCDKCGERWELGTASTCTCFLKREWIGLTDEEMSAAMDYWSDPVRSAYGGAVSANEEYVDMVATWRYIEAKLRSKNES